MKIYTSCWRLVGGFLFAVGVTASAAHASYTSTDNRLHSPVYRSTNPVSFSTAGGQYTIDSFFDVFADFQRFPPPLTNAPQNDSFFDVFTELYITPPGGASSPVRPSKDQTIRLNGLPPGTPYPYVFDTEMLQLNLQGGGLPGDVRIRESPTRASTGKTTIADLGGGLYQIDSFFDVFTELSIDNGQSWVPASGSLHIDGGLPEPSSAVLALMGLVAVGGVCGRRGKR